MRIVLVGASALTKATARALLDRGHEVVVIEPDERRLAELDEELDCGLLHGDGTRPKVLKEVGPENTDCLLALGESDQDNIIAALVGRELAFGNVIVKIGDAEYEKVCSHLGLKNTVVPDLEVGRSLADMVESKERASMTTRLRGNLRFFSFRAGAGEAGSVGRLELPSEARIVALTRDGRSHLADEGVEIREGDEVLMIIDARHAPDLHKRFSGAG